MKLFKLTICFCFLIYTHLSFAQTCKPNIIADMPNNRYTMNLNGTVLDKKTGLTWMRCSLGQTWNNTACTGSVQYFDWQSALQTAESTVFAGLNDWRLPNIKELDSLVETSCYSPATNLIAFPGITNELFWSSSHSAGDNTDVWIVNFLNGENSNGYAPSSNNAVRLVTTNNVTALASIHYGIAPEGMSTEAAILALPTLASSASGQILTLNLTNGNFAYFAVPSTIANANNVTFTEMPYNEISAWDGATWPFEGIGETYGPLSVPGTLNGSPITWYLYRTDFSDLNSITYKFTW